MMKNLPQSNENEAAKLTDRLRAMFPESSGSTLKKWILHGLVSVNGTIVTNPSSPVQPGDTIEYRKSKFTKGKRELPFPLLYEDGSIIVVDKPAGMLTYGVRGSEGTSVYRELSEFIDERSKGHESVWVVHRLDREVSGVLLFAKFPSIQQKIKESWPRAEKHYRALVVGAPPEPQGTISGWLAENKAQRVYVTGEEPGAKFAVTHFKVLKTLPGHTLLDVRLETGRKHQIRVHLADLGCPVAGDAKYSEGAEKYGRIRLHALSLSIIHPVTEETMTFESALPPGFLSTGHGK
jgi:23S rRNA pseudouridine1911/1915/1917 synthase